MISSAATIACCLVSVAGQLDPAASPSPSDRPASIAPKRTVSARVADVIRVEPPALTLKMPTDVAVDRDGVILVADGVNDRVAMISADGSYLGDLSRFDNLSLANPIGLAVDANNRLWITDNGHHRIVRVSSDRSSAEAIELNMPEAESIDPTGVVVSADLARTYVVDNDHHRILVRDNDGGRVRIAGSGGAALGQLQWPFLASLDADGALYVTEAIGARVQRLDTELKWTGVIGRWGIEEGQLYRPKGVAIDAGGRVLISDSTLGAVQAFSAEGRFLGVLTDGSGEILRFAHPMGMAIDRAGRLLVVETSADQISVVEFAPADQDEGSR